MGNKNQHTTHSAADPSEGRIKQGNIDVKLGTSVAIIDTSNKVLLTKREDFHVWCLPGGMVSSGESIASAAVREVKEELGVDISLRKLIGLYSRTGTEDVHAALFTANIKSGCLVPNPSEVLQIAYFDVGHLPGNLMWWHRQMVVDCFSGIDGAYAWHFKISMPFTAIDRAHLYSLRDESGLSRYEFYRLTYESLGCYNPACEVSPSS